MNGPIEELLSHGDAENNVDRQYEIASEYIKISSQDYDEKQALHWFERVYKNKKRNNEKDIKYYHALFYLGLGLLKKRGKDINKATGYLKAVADFSYASELINDAILNNALYVYGSLLHNGLDFGLKRSDPGEASNYFLRLQDKYNQMQEKDAEALFNLGRMYQRGYGCEQNDKDALDCYYAAAHANPPHPSALNNLGWMCKLGRGVSNNTPDLNKAKDYFTQAEVLGEPFASFNLGTMHLLGLSVKKDTDIANSYFAKTTKVWSDLVASTAEFSIDGMLAVGYIYFVGVGNITRDVAKAEYWLDKVIETRDDNFKQSRHAYAEAYYLLGQIYDLEKNNMHKAQAAFLNASNHGHQAATTIYQEEYGKFKCFMKNNPGANRVHAYAFLGDLGALKKLFLTNPDSFANHETHSKKTALHFAAAGGHEDVVRYLFSNPKLNLLDTDDMGNTALHLAVNSKKNTSLIKSLLNRNYNACFIQNKSNKTPIEYVMESPELMTIFIEFKQQESGSNLLHLMIEHVQFPVFEKFANLGVLKQLIHKKNSDGKTALHIAAQKGKLHIGALLLEQGANLLEKDAKGRTALMLAASKGNVELIRKFFGSSQYSCLDKKAAYFNAVDNNGNTALHYAVENRDTATINLLLDQEVDANIFNADGKSPLMLAIEKIDTNVVKALLARKVSILRANHANQSAMEFAFGCENSSREITKLLLREREKFSVDYIDSIIKQCLQNYSGSENQYKDDCAMIETHVNRLIFGNIKDVYNHTMELKCFAQWHGIDGRTETERGSQNFGFWRVEDFLALNIRYLFEYILRFRKGFEIPLDKNDNSLYYGLVRELCIELEMLRARKDYILIYDNDQLDADFLNAFATNIANKAFSNKEDLPFCAGTNNHTNYATFNVMNGIFYMRIDDVGLVKNNVKIKQDGEKYYYPLVAGVSQVDFDKNKFKDYLNKLIQAQTSPADENSSPVYKFEQYGFKTFNKEQIENLAEIPARPQQKANNCVVENFKIGLEIRLEKVQKGLYRKVVCDLLSEFNKEKFYDADVSIYPAKVARCVTRSSSSETAPRSPNMNNAGFFTLPNGQTTRRQQAALATAQLQSDNDKAAPCPG